MEYFYLNAEISWTWLNLGNGFAYDIALVQWYEFTGALGGTLWVLLSNLVIFLILDAFRKGAGWKDVKSKSWALGIIILLPLLFSVVRFYTYKEVSDPYEIVVVQPNIDPYEKYNNTQRP